MKVLLAMSGGVDSSVSGYLLQKFGYYVEGVTFDLGITKREKFNRDVMDAKAVADNLGIKHRVVSYKDYFKKEVVDGFIESYKLGKTPNPCVVCNRVLKFGKLMDYALENGFDKLATGHYANITEISGKYYLKKAKDERKDQTYFIYGAGNLDRVIFPLGGYTKDNIRDIAHKLNIKTMDKKDSQEVCFIENDYRDFLKTHTKNLPKSGDFVDINGNVLGRHVGCYNYTIGQRKGLNIALGQRAYVVDIDTNKNTVTLGTEEMLYRKKVIAKMPSTIDARLLQDKIYEVKTRYTMHGKPAKVKCKGNLLIGEFIDPVRAPAIGQSMVVYDGDIVITGGEIIDSYKD